MSSSSDLKYNPISRSIYLMQNFVKQHKWSMVILVLLSLSYSVYSSYKNSDFGYSTLVIDTKGAVHKEVLGEMILDYFRLPKNSNQDLLSVNNRYGTCEDQDIFSVDITFYLSLDLEQLNTQLQAYLCSDEFSSNSTFSTEFKTHSCKLIQKPFGPPMVIPSSIFKPFSAFLKLFVSGVFLLWFLHQIGVLRPRVK